MTQVAGRPGAPVRERLTAPLARSSVAQPLTTGPHTSRSAAADRACARIAASPRGLPAELAAIMRPRLGVLIEQTTTQIQGEVGAYAGPRRGRRRRLIEMAVSGAVNYFVDALEGRHEGRAQVDDLFRRMGRGEALDGNSLEAMRAAHDIAIRDAWHELHSVAVAGGLSAADLGRLGDALFAFMEHLGDEVSRGYHAAQAEIGHATHRARAELLDALLERRPAAELERLSVAARWPLPRRCVVVTADLDTDAPGAELVLVDTELLARLGAPLAVALVPLRDAGDTGGTAAVQDGVEELRDLAPVGRVAVSWPVALEELPDALRWGRRALELARQGVLPADDVLDHADHVTALWLQSEPLLRRRICADVLAPLLRETPHSREVLARTLLAWLSTHDSAPALARRLGVHAQTVRYRLRRLRDLLGDGLDDPETVLAMKLALEALLPLWSAGQRALDVEHVLSLSR